MIPRSCRDMIADMKTAIVTGAAGFAGCNLTEHLLEHGFEVYAVLRPESKHNTRLKESESLHKIELDMSELAFLPERIGQSADIFFHLAWDGGRNDFAVQYKNVEITLQALKTAKALSCSVFLCTGSQAEYGVKEGLITEELSPEPFSSYGAAKAAACYLSKDLAKQEGIRWVWARIFSLYGKYEPAGRMLPDLIRSLKEGHTPELSSCRQSWDYLDAGDAAEALIALAERGGDGEIYNIANGDHHPLKDFTERVRQIYAPELMIGYGADPSPFVSLRPSVEKLKRDTGWEPEVSFEAGVRLNY